MQEKRRHKRYTLKVLEVTGRMILASEVEVIDISIGGISIKATNRLNIGEEYALTLEDMEKSISLKGSVVWSALSETRKGSQGEVIPIYKAGLEFRDIPVEKITEILNFVEAHKKEEIYTLGSSRLNIRFHISDETTSFLNLPASCRVKKISLGGMLIECVMALEINSRIPMELFLHDERAVRFTGRVASCLSLDTGRRKSYDIGIEFLELSDRDMDVLKSFVDYCALIEGAGEAG